jgi:hypothetical protein
MGRNELRPYNARGMPLKIQHGVRSRAFGLNR